MENSAVWWKKKAWVSQSEKGICAQLLLSFIYIMSSSCVTASVILLNNGYSSREFYQKLWGETTKTSIHVLHSLVENALTAFKVYFVRQPNVADEDDLVAVRALVGIISWSIIKLKH